jgi:hypothetical protein
LELGPLEGGHTFQLLKQGAKVTAVEANSEAFLKCLIVKELLGLEDAQFLYGDVTEYLATTAEQFDLIFCCGVMYHMEDPVRLVRLMAEHTRRVFLWTHFYDAGAMQYREHFKGESVIRDNERYTYYRRFNIDRAAGRFWGGNADSACMLSRADLERVFMKYGFSHQLVHAEEPNNPAGPAVSMSLWAG